MQTTHAAVLDEITALYQGYSNEYRTTTQPYRLQTVRSRLLDYEYQVEDLLIREYKHPYMLWNEFMTQLHLELLHRLDSMLQVYY